MKALKLFVASLVATCVVVTSASVAHAGTRVAVGVQLDLFSLFGQQACPPPAVVVQPVVVAPIPAEIGFTVDEVQLVSIPVCHVERVLVTDYQLVLRRGGLQDRIACGTHVEYRSIPTGECQLVSQPVRQHYVAHWDLTANGYTYVDCHNQVRVYTMPAAVNTAPPPAYAPDTTATTDAPAPAPVQ